MVIQCNRSHIFHLAYVLSFYVISWVSSFMTISAASCQGFVMTEHIPFVRDFSF